MNEVKELLGLKRNKVKIIKIEEQLEQSEKVQVITLVGTTNKVKCSIYLKYTSSVHDKLKPMIIKYNKIFDKKCCLILHKRRFICYRCNKRFIEDLGIISISRSISNSLEIKVRKNLLKPNFNINQIAKDNEISEDKVICILLDAMNNYPTYVKILP